MKIIKYFSVGLVCLLALNSCESDFLERSPEVNISDGEFWKSKNDLKLYTNNFYNNFLPSYQGYFTQGIYGLDSDEGTDNMVHLNFNGNILNGERIVPSSGGGWSITEWGRIRNVNYFLQNYTKSTENFEVIKEHVGEAHYFRALLYFDLLKKFGDLPWIDKALTPSDADLLKAPRVSRAIIADNILADLDKATLYLPTKAASSSNRVYREVAMALQARIALYEGTWEKYHAGTPFGVAGSNGDKYLTKAATVSKAIIDSGIFDLDNKATGSNRGYWSLFNQSNYSNSREVIFWRRYDVASNFTNRWAEYGARGNGKGFTKSLVDDYLCIDGKPISSSSLYQGDETLIDIVTNRDPRLKQSIHVNDGAHPITNNRPSGLADLLFTNPIVDQATEDNCSTGFQRFKGTEPNYAKQLNGMGDAGLIFFRYAEVLLNYAEAKAELGTITQGDLDISINQLRARVQMPNLVMGLIVSDPNWAFPTLSPVINEVRRERRIELAVEGFRHDDIWRWAAADELIIGKKPLGAKKAQWANVPGINLYNTNAEGYVEPYKNVGAMATGYKFKADRDYLLPIPLNQITLAGYKQNPNW
ncbi:RagB/SusD family nutrient uptake outer membrane protein [Flavobacterium hiemivividum]|uniref:RagB/SusD family nutrient uptake outer membrane protein n=1 Tax=Flavobacterium hiemivividum TaxID=2541734 RepID=A0A4R5CW44_9FLAO|nr:RagB/SusD family nutrient uptake outer membrane protein [Flavobacterium hiemivividum]TDE03251.1 RagB/SusD family nutrient uptake outer membrane protein [Flavobacterium hiemivividum]